MIPTGRSSQPTRIVVSARALNASSRVQFGRTDLPLLEQPVIAQHALVDASFGAETVEQCDIPARVLRQGHAVRMPHNRPRNGMVDRRSMAAASAMTRLAVRPASGDLDHIGSP
jgi:hypothetical protein